MAEEVMLEASVGPQEISIVPDDPTPMPNPDASASQAPKPVSLPNAARGVPVDSILGDSTAEDFDWKSYESSYKDRALLSRLWHLASLVLSSSSSSRSPQSLALGKDALERLVPLVKQTWDTGMYMQISNALSDPPIRPKRAQKMTEDIDMGDATVSPSSSGPIGAFKTSEGLGRVDTDWIEQVREAEKKEMGRLDTELKGYTSNLIKESMRLTYLAFAQTNMKAGRLSDVLKAYANAREYSTSPVNMVELGVGVIQACLAFHQPSSLPGHISKLEAAMERAYPNVKVPASANRPGGDAASLTAADVRDAQDRDARSASIRRTVGIKIRVAKAVVAMSLKDFERAGREAAEALEEGGLGDWEGRDEVISTPDLALIAAISTLATGSRERVRRVLLDRASFRTALDDGQGWIIELVRALLEAEYTELSSLLLKAEPALLLCPFTAAHTHRLTSAIRLRAMVQYVSPFSSVKIATMATAFGANEASMMWEVERMLLDKQIQGRLDLVDGVLEMTQRDHRQAMFKEALEMGKESTKATKAALLRIRLQEAKIIVDPRPAGSGFNGNGDGHGGDDWVDPSLYNGAGAVNAIDSDEDLRDDLDMN